MTKIKQIWNVTWRLLATFLTFHIIFTSTAHVIITGGYITPANLENHWKVAAITFFIILFPVGPTIAVWRFLRNKYGLGTPKPRPISLDLLRGAWVFLAFMATVTFCAALIIKATPGMESSEGVPEIMLAAAMFNYFLAFLVRYKEQKKVKQIQGGGQP